MPRSRRRWSRGSTWSKSLRSRDRPWSGSWTTGSTSSRWRSRRRQAKKKQHVILLKEVKYRPGIETHDFDTKTRHAREFLGDGNKVKVTLMFRGRQIAHPELGRAVVQRVAVALADVSKIETDARLEGKALTMILTPK